MNSMGIVTNNIEILKDNKSDFTELILNIENELYSIAKNKVSNPNDIDDILQETIIKIYKNFNSLKSLDSFRAWSISILLNECKRSYKAQHKNTLLLNKIINKDIFSNNDNSITELENDLSFKELLKHLSNIDQNIFILYYQCNYSIKEIAKILGLNENTVKSKLKRTKCKIKENYMKGRDKKDEM